ncbi:hypothetical protein EDB84DRAFT_1562589 [Lactarius hengduanensis]|nr:hypothetical protein EDB84DRAFT_1562589 [Lactarius hengduanensis]
MDEYSESRTPSPDVIKVAAPLLFGPLFNWALYGVLCVQIYVYSYNFPGDGRPIRFLVYFVFVLETAQTALTGADIYYWFVDGFGDAERLAHSHFSPIDSPIMTAVISLIVQGYFCFRIWTLKRSLWLCCAITAAAVTQSTAGMWAGIKSLTIKGYLVTKTALFLWSIPSALADILIAVAMTLLLRRASNSNFSSFVLIRVVRTTIETNALTASLAITILVLYAIFPNELHYMTKVLGKVYSNTLLVSLNNRIYFREHQSSGRGNSADLPVSKRVRVPAVTLPSFAVAKLPPQAQKGGTFPLYAITQRPVDLDISKCDATGTDLSLPHVL